LGFLSRDSSLDRVVYDIQGALRGEACLPRDKLAPVLRLLIERRREDDERAERLGRLSRRETEVLDHLATGATNEQIAGTLFLSQATVRTHVQNILTKLEVHSRLEAIALVHESGARR
jgi:DNA-binding NarL/FixJ family response regulator